MASGIANGSSLQRLLNAGIQIVPVWDVTVTWTTPRGRLADRVFSPPRDALAEAQKLLANITSDRVERVVLTRVWKTYKLDKAVRLT